MSAYLDFFLRKDNTFAPLGTFSRSSRLYRMFESIAPWEKITPITSTDLAWRVDKVAAKLDEWKTNQAVVRNRIELVMRAYNPLADKLEAVAELEKEIEDYQETIDEYQYVYDYLHFLLRVLDTVAYDENYNEDTYLYAGIECGLEVTVEDIEED